MANTRTVGASGADHTTIASAMSWMAANHTLGVDGIGKIEIIDSAEYTEEVDVSGISGTASITSYIELTASSGNRHSGVAGTGHARLHTNPTSNSAVITVSENFTYIHHLEIHLSSSAGASDEGIRVIASDVLISRNVVWSTDVSSSKDGIYTGNWNADYSIDNCVIYGFNRGGIHMQNHGSSETQVANIDHCTVYNCGQDAGGIEDGGIVLRGDFGTTTTANIYNTAGIDSNSGSAEDYVMDRNGSSTITWTGTHNADSDGTLTSFSIDTNGQQNLVSADTTQSTGSYFVVNDLTGGSEDLRLLDDAAGNLAEGTGTSRIGSEPDARQDFSLDIAGNTRDTVPDIGASEYVSDSGVTGTVAVTQADQTMAATGQVGLDATGTIAVTQDDQTSNATGVVGTIVTGTIAVTQDDQISAATGQVGLTITGTIAVTQDDQISAAVGIVGDIVTGTIAVTQDNQIASATGQIGLDTTGTVAVLQENQIMAAIGVISENITGTIATTQEDQTMSAVGFIGDPGDFLQSQPINISISISL